MLKDSTATLRDLWAALERVVKEMPEHEQLFVLMDANARTGRRRGGKLGSEECKVPGAYDRDTPNDDGERLLSFSANHELALLNAFFSAAKNAISHSFNGRGKKRIDYILTRQRDRKLVRDVIVHPQPPFLPISNHNIITAHVKLLGRFARNRPVREAKEPPPIDQRRLTTDPHLRQEVAKMIGDHLRAFPPSSSSFGDVETALTIAILQTAERIALPRAPKLPGRGWRGDAQAEAEMSMATAARRAAWKRQSTDTQRSQLMRDVRRENTRFHMVCNVALERFLERHLQGMEEDLCQRDQRGLFQRFKYLNTRGRFTGSTFVTRRAECFETQGLSSGGGRGSSAPSSSRNPISSVSTSSKGSPSYLSHTLLGSNRRKTS